METTLNHTVQAMLKHGERRNGKESGDCGNRHISKARSGGRRRELAILPDEAIRKQEGQLFPIIYLIYTYVRVPGNRRQDNRL